MTEGLFVRPATREDCRLYWEWANEEAVRAASFSSEPIPWSTHVAWFETRVGAPDCRLYLVCEASGDPVAQVRFEIEGEKAVVSISVGAEHRHKGYGLRALELSMERLFSETNVRTFDAFIRPDNEASLRLFERAGYSEARGAIVRGQTAVCMTLSRDLGGRLPGER